MANIQKKNRRKNRNTWFFKRKGFWLFLILCGLMGAAAGWLFFDNYTREYRDRAERFDLDRINDLEIPSLIVDRNGKEIGRVFVQNRSVIPIEEVPKIFIDALRAGEDQRFNTHDGVDYIGVARAFYLNWKAGETTQGASTITQQLARNAFNLEGERKKLGETSMQRKIVEAFLARRIEKRYKKSQILGFYLNRIYFGSGYHGIRSASLGYFGKEPAKLNALESAAIVGCIKNPTNLSPINNPEGNRHSRNLVLGRMVDLGAIQRSEARRLSVATLKLNPKPIQRETSHLYERIAENVARVLGEDSLVSGGFTVHTTILKEAQDAAQAALLASLTRAESRAGFTRPKYHKNPKQGAKPEEFLQGAVLAVDHSTGEVLAHVGGRDYAQSQFDFIESGKRPAGTAFFPFIYAAALEHGMTPATLVEDEAMDNRSVMVGGREGILGEWGMEVSSPTYQGEIPLRAALENSKIAATVRVADQIGLSKVVGMACAFGLPLENAELLRRLAVGFEQVSLKQLVRAMAAFPSAGRLGPEDLMYVDRVESPSGRVVYRREHRPVPRTEVINGATAWQMHSMLAGSLYRGSSKGVLDELIEIPFHGAGKGGSTHDFSDCWFVGYNKRVTCGVWTGFLSGSDEIYPGAFSRDLAMPVWQATMNAVAPSFGGGSLAAPPNVVEVQVCSVSGQRATQFCQEYADDPGSGQVRSRSTAVSEYFRRGTEKIAFCSVHSGVGGDGTAIGMDRLNLPALDAVPVQPKAPVLIGDDPYHTEFPSFAATSKSTGLIRRRTNVLDSLDLGDIEEPFPLRRPQRLEIMDE